MILSTSARRLEILSSSIRFSSASLSSSALRSASSLSSSAFLSSSILCASSSSSVGIVSSDCEVTFVSVIVLSVVPHPTRISVNAPTIAKAILFLI